jgi:hypothetical protein
VERSAEPDAPGRHRRDCPRRHHHNLRDRPPHFEGRHPGSDRPGAFWATRPLARWKRVGTGVKSLKVGDRVLVSCVSACGRCHYCRQGHFGQCLDGGGWILGHNIDGTQAELVRVPFADTSTYAIPKGVSDEEMLMLADILPTAFEVGVLQRTRPTRRRRRHRRCGPHWALGDHRREALLAEHDHRHRLRRRAARRREALRRRSHLQQHQGRPHRLRAQDDR